MPAVAAVWTLLERVADPEIPVLSIVDLGIVRDVAVAADGSADVTITPTYSGCPATRTIERDIVATLGAHGLPVVRLHVTLAPAWTTDWISARGCERLRAYGIAPPRRDAPAIACPRCGADATELLSSFGSTPCKALRRCTACKEPFDHFKCH
ncbi:MAG: phenylacetate-CoA oxygenase subunit PaaJ [Vulcanimicrobiaceae bacterium]